MFNIYMIMYIIAAFLVIGGGSYKITQQQQSVAALFFFIGSLTLFIIYGIRWFSQSGSLFSATPVSWPPVINTCPDYLTYYKRGAQDTCIDLIGIARCGGNQKCLKRYVKGTDDDAYFFDLTTKSSDGPSKKAELCKRSMEYGLTWEGITNGEACISSTGSTSPNSGSADSQCTPN